MINTLSLFVRIENDVLIGVIAASAMALAGGMVALDISLKAVESRAKCI